MGKRLRLWPLLGLPLMWLCNIDLYVIPFLQIYFSFFTTAAIACIMATAELVYLYWVIGWIAANLKKKAISSIKEQATKEPDEMHEGIALAKEIILEVKEELHEEGLIDRIVAFIQKYLDPNKVKDLLIFKVIYWGGYPALFLMAIIPEPGLRLLGTFLCRIVNWRGAFIALLFGNIIKTIAMVEFHDYFSEINLWLRIAAILIVFVFFSLILRLINNHFKKLA